MRPPLFLFRNIPHFFQKKGNLIMRRKLLFILAIVYIIFVFICADLGCTMICSRLFAISFITGLLIYPALSILAIAIFVNA